LSVLSENVNRFLALVFPSVWGLHRSGAKLDCAARM
jgi:hypothetical protein